VQQEGTCATATTTTGAHAAAPAAPAPAKPVVAEFAVEPGTIERGQTAALRWNVTGATGVVIDKRNWNGSGQR